MKAEISPSVGKIRASSIRNIISASILALTSSAVLATENPFDFLLEKYSADQLQMAVANHTIVATSEDSIHQIPSSYLYRSAFLRILLNVDNSREDFSANDWAIIEALPDHNDNRFAKLNLERMKANCSRIRELSRSSSGHKISNMAALAAESERQPLIDLDNHYAEVLSSLSPEGRSRVEAEVENLPNVSNMTWSTVDLVNLSDEIPEYVEFVVTQSCERLRTTTQPDYETQLLKDAHLNWDRMETR
ncbi:MAG: hypothetical protein WD071_07355 [Pseudohongiella sp.]|uniref:hypothetical protein n=1 Tax=Pseudohongiella sp. TaxID=1979412 RepID=UPI0034A07110